MAHMFPYTCGVHAVDKNCNHPLSSLAVHPVIVGVECFESRGIVGMKPSLSSVINWGVIHVFHNKSWLEIAVDTIFKLL